MYVLVQKTKPTQNSIRKLREYGLTPNIIACRCTKVCIMNPVTGSFLVLSCGAFMCFLKDHITFLFIN